MQRLSQISSHLIERPESGVTASRYSSTPREADRGSPANTNTTMAKTKVVVTRRLIEEAQRILDEKKSELEIVQWQSEKVGRNPQR